MAGNPNILTPSQLRNPLVDKDGLLTRQWYDFFGTVSDTIRQVIINTVTVEDQGPVALFGDSNSVDPAIIAALNPQRLDFLDIRQPASAARPSLLALDIQPAKSQATQGSQAVSKSTLATWEPYVATVTPSAGVWTPSAQDSASMIDGDTVTLRINATGTQVTTTPGSVSLSLVYSAVGSQSISGYAILGASPAIPVYGLISGTTATVFKIDNSNFALGSIQIVLTGVYQGS